MTAYSSFADLLIHTASARGDAPAVSAGDQTLSYAELSYEVRRFAAWWAERGGRRGDRVAIFLEKRIETVVAIFGTSLAGGVVVPINPVLKGRQVAYILSDSGAETLVTSHDRWTAIEKEVVDVSLLARILLVGESTASRDYPSPASVWDDMAPGEITQPRVLDVDLAMIIYTSGSTGPPKGVALSHRNLIVGAESVNEYLGNRSDDVILAVLPLSFDAGLSQLTSGFAAGAHVVLIDYLLPRDVLAACRRYGVTAMTAVPPLWTRLATHDWSQAGQSMRYIATTGGRLPRSTLDSLRARLPHVAVFLMYGLTEAFRSTYLEPVEVDRRPDSIGKAIPHAEIVVLRPDGTECSAGEPGELVHRGALVALGYWNNEPKTAERFRPWPPSPGSSNAWRQQERAVWSGDTVVRDDEGFLYFVSRSDEMIKRSGYRISPTEVEEAALATGLISEAVALGRDEPGIGQRIVLILGVGGRSFDQARLKAELRSVLPTFMQPDEFVVLDQLPRNPNGKYDRARLKEQYA
jgi:acyl-CoA ligase (AMP-forming) (exosortase A-associated)